MKKDDDITTWKMGEILIAQKDIVEDTMYGTKEVIKKGSKAIIGFDKLLHHYNGKISHFGKNIEIKGYSGSGIAQYIYDYLKRKIPLDEMLEDYEITPQDFMDEIVFLLDEIGIQE